MRATEGQQRALPMWELDVWPGYRVVMRWPLTDGGLDYGVYEYTGTDTWRALEWSAVDDLVQGRR